MTKKMLIDAAHAEETRVVVTDGNRIEEFDFESQGRKQLRGNIYLAKVTRVEPSLQAAFVEYGGNRHGFLAFNEIHPDYYQIPVADREKLMRGLADDEDDHLPGPVAKGEDGEDLPPRRSSDDDDDMEEEVERRRRRLMKHYKIQEVIRRRQIMLIQVVKEERGNKGAALTTYLSLAGRYGVLMPNTDRGGGISRKITSTTDRRRLKSVVQNLDVPEGMGLIIRTAGAKRTKAEVQRDYEYLLRLWGDIREKTLHSVAPALIYEEEDLVKRAIRDMFDKDIDGVWVEGENGFRAARDFMRMLMPSQAKKVQAYRERTPLFVAHKLEGPLSQIYSPVVPLKSGGYLVINQTEALVAIDVNSGKATRERNIEATAFKTNMEAAEEACRQLRLRDLAGLIVIDFIDMEEGKNNRAVEKKLKDCLKDDRARVQMGRISSFGLMEISRQRRRTGVLEGTTHVCPHCAGVGRVRSVESSALAALRGVEIEALKGGGELTLRVPAHVGFYILNEKRAHLARVHQVHDLYVTVMVDDSLGHDAHAIERTSLGEHSTHAIEAYAPNQYLDDPADAFDNDVEDEVEDEDEDLIDAEDEDAFEREDSDDDEPAARTEARSEERSESADAGEDGEDRRGRGRRRRRRGGRRDEVETVVAAPADPDAVSAPGAEEDDDSEDAQGRRRRRGRRGGRRTRDDARPQDGFTWSRPRVPFGDDPFVWHDPAALEGGAALTPPPARPAPAPRVEAEAAPVAAPVIEASPEAVAEVLPVVPAAPESTDDIWVELPAEVEPAKKPRRSRAKAKVKNDEMAAAESAVTQPDPDAPVVTAPMETTADRIQPSVMRTEENDSPAAEPEPVAVATVVEPVPEVLPEPVAEVVVEAPPATPEPAMPDPAEIAAPPEKPKRGWWRR